MTVAELKKVLETIPDDALVWAYDPDGDLVTVDSVGISRSDPGDHNLPTSDGDHFYNLKDHSHFGEFYRNSQGARKYQERIDKHFPITHIIMETWKW